MVGLVPSECNWSDIYIQNREPHLLAGLCCDRGWVREQAGACIAGQLHLGRTQLRVQPDDCSGRQAQAQEVAAGDDATAAAADL
jgi:hypothetical protein